MNEGTGAGTIAGMILEIENASEVSSTVEPRLALARRTVTIGRRPGADWCLHDPTRLVSSIHCTIEPVAGGYLLTDRSRNGTIVDGETVEGGTATLRDGTSLRVGPYRIRARLDRAVAGGEPKVAAHPPRSSGPAHDPVVSNPPIASRSAAASEAVLANIDTLAAIEEAAGLAPDTLAGRSADAVVRDLALAAAQALDALGRCEALARAVLDGTVDPDASSGRLARALEEGSDLAGTSMADAMRATDALDALSHAVPVALFRLLNRLSPPTVEDAVRGGPGADARRWRLYRERWEDMAMGSENGMLDLFREELRGAHAERMAEL